MEFYSLFLPWIISGIYVSSLIIIYLFIDYVIVGTYFWHLILSFIKDNIVLIHGEHQLSIDNNYERSFLNIQQFINYSLHWIYTRHSVSAFLYIFRIAIYNWYEKILPTFISYFVFIYLCQVISVIKEMTYNIQNDLMCTTEVFHPQV